MQRSLLRLSPRRKRRGTGRDRCGTGAEWRRANAGIRGRKKRNGTPNCGASGLDCGGESAGNCGTSADDAEKLSGLVAGPEEGAGAGLSGEIRKNIRRACGAVRGLCGDKRPGAVGASSVAGFCASRRRARIKRDCGGVLRAGPESRGVDSGAGVEERGLRGGRRACEAVRGLCGVGWTWILRRRLFANIVGNDSMAGSVYSIVRSRDEAVSYLTVRG